MREAHSIELSAVYREEMVVVADRNSPQKHSVTGTVNLWPRLALAYQNG